MRVAADAAATAERAVIQPAAASASAAASSSSAEGASALASTARVDAINGKQTMGASGKQTISGNGKQPLGKQPLNPPPCRKVSHVRCSDRLKQRQRSDPLQTLDEDSLRLVMRPLSAGDIRTLHSVSKAWRLQVQQLVRSQEWRDKHGCVYPSSLCKIVTESGVARLDLGPEVRMHRVTRASRARAKRRLAQSLPPSSVSLPSRRAPSAHPSLLLLSPQPWPTHLAKPIHQPTHTPVPKGTYCDHMLSASMETDLTRLVFRRLDGPSIGPISTNHTMGIFDQTAAASEEPPSAATGRRRLDLISVPFKPQVAAKESATTQLWLRPLPPRVRAEAAASGGVASGRSSGSAAGVAPLSVSSSDCVDGGGGCDNDGIGSGDSSGSQDEPLCYDEVFGIFDCHGQVRLRIGSGNFQERWSSRLRIVCVPRADAQAAASVVEPCGTPVC